MMLTYGLLQTYYGLVYESIQDLVERGHRGIAMATYLVVMYLGGASWGPLVTGQLGDRFAGAAAWAGRLAGYYRSRQGQRTAQRDVRDSGALGTACGCAVDNRSSNVTMQVAAGTTSLHDFLLVSHGALRRRVRSSDSRVACHSSFFSVF